MIHTFMHLKQTTVSPMLRSPSQSQKNIEPESEVKELPIETLVDLSTEPNMRLLSLSPPMISPLSLSSPDIYDYIADLPT